MGEMIRAIVQRRHDQAAAERAYHLSRGSRLYNVEALAASLKMHWARNVLAEIDALLTEGGRTGEGE